MTSCVVNIVILAILCCATASTAQDDFIVILKDDVVIPELPAYEYFQIGLLRGGFVNTGGLQTLVDLGVVAEQEKDQEIFIDGFAENEIETETDSLYQWGLDRIDQRHLPLSGSGSYLPPNNGSGTYVYVLDTGARITHQEFESRVEYGYTHYPPIAADGHGHGTHVMSTVLGKNVGVASEARGVAVKVLSDGGSGSNTGVIRGIEWAVNDITSKQRCGVISMSLGSSRSSVMNTAVNAAVAAGVPVVVSSGNNNGNSCLKSPASASSAISVGSTTKSDSRSYFSNYGMCTDIFAPGSSILGAKHTGDSSYVSFSGTSMACPHVSGSLAILFQQNQCNVQESLSRLLEAATEGKVKSLPSGENFLLHLGFDDTARPSSGPTETPTASPAAPTTTVPTIAPTNIPSSSPTTPRPSTSPVTTSPSASPVTQSPSASPTAEPTASPNTVPCWRQCRRLRRRRQCNRYQPCRCAWSSKPKRFKCRIKN